MLCYILGLQSNLNIYFPLFNRHPFSPYPSLSVTPFTVFILLPLSHCIGEVEVINKQRLVVDIKLPLSMVKMYSSILIMYQTHIRLTGNVSSEI